MMYGEVGRLADEALRLSVLQAENAALLTVALHYAWLDLCLDTCRAAESAMTAELEQQARTRRLIRRGVAPALAARELRIV